MTDRPDPALRILIGAESAADAPRALRLLPILAEGGSAMFGGLLVMDQALEHLQTDAGQRIVTAKGQLVAAPDAARVKALLEVETRVFRKMLSDIARASGAEWSAEAKVGTLGANLAAVASAWDIVVLGHRALHRRRGAVVILGGTTGDNTLPALAARMASRLETNVVTLPLPGPEEAPSAWLADRLNRLNASAVILDAAAAPVEGFRNLTALLTMARCPIVILGGARLQPQLEHSVQITPPPEPEA